MKFFARAAAVILPLFVFANSALARPLGIDVSSFQGTSVNWPTAKNSDNIAFAWAKATEGAGVNDADYVYNMSNGKPAGVIMGSYHYAHPELNTAATEAAHFWGRASTYTLSDNLSLMPMLDIEGNAFNGNIGSTSISDWINDWSTDIVQDGANNSVTLAPIIYVSACNACNFDTTVSQWGADIADYNGQSSQTGTPWSTCTSCERWGNATTGWDFWQYSSTGGINAYSGNIDKDVFNGTDTVAMSPWVVGGNTNSTIYYWDPQNVSGSNPYTGSMTGTWENAKWSYSSGGLATPVNWVNGKAACFGVHTGIGTPAYTVTMNSNHVVAGFFDGPLTPNACDVTISGTGTINLASGAQGLDAHNASDGSLAIMRLNVNIAGSGQMFPEGNGVTYLHGSNTFSGGYKLGYADVSAGTNNFTGTNYFNNAHAFGTGTITLWSHGTGTAVILEGSNAITVTNPVAVATATTNNLIGNAAGLIFSGNWDLSGGLLQLGGGSTAGNQTIIAGTMSGNKGFTVYNSATIVLIGTNTYTGTTTINSPTVLQLDGTGTLGSGAYSGAIINNGTFVDSSTATQTLSGVVSGTGSVRVADAGTLILTGANTFTGGTTVSNNGVLALNADSGLGTAAGALTLNGGSLKNNNVAVTLTSSRTITLGANGGYLDGAGSSSTTLTISSKLSGSGKLLINQDNAPVVLNNTGNNWGGNTVIGTNGPGYNASGTQAQLKMGASNVLPFGSGFSGGSITINSAYLGVLEMNGTTQNINGLSGDGVINNSTGSGSLTIGNNNITSTFTGTIQNSGGTLAITKTSTGTLTLGGTNTYSGSTTISAGTLALSGTGSISNTASIILAAGSTLDVSAIPTFALNSSSSLNASGTTSPCTIKGGTTVSLGSRPITLNYDGSHPALTVSQGTLSLNGNALTVNGSVLADGSYILIQQTTGNIAATGGFTVSGTALGGKPALIGVSGGNVTLYLNMAPSITSQPQGTTVNQSSNALFSVTATGATPLSCQWRRNGVNISGATDTSYTRTNVQPADAGSYSVIVSNFVSSTTSTDAVLGVNIPPSITTQPQSQSAGPGANVAFSVVASGTAPLSYQWRKDGANVVGANTSTYTRTSVTANDAGSYFVVVTNVAGVVTSSDATLTVDTCAISLNSINVSSGVNATLSYAVDPGNNYTLQTKNDLTDAQWQDANTVTAGSSILTMNDVGVTHSQKFYRLASTCTATPPAGFITLSLLGNSDTFVSMPFVRPAASAPTVVSYSGNIVTVALPTGQAWTSNQFVYVQGSQSNNYYARFASGALNGAIFAITANDTNTLTLYGDLSGVVANDLIYVEPYWSLNSIFPGGQGVNISQFAGNRNTEVLIPDLTSAGVNLSAAKIYYFNAGIWKQLGQGATDYGDDIIQPNTYFVVRHNVSTNTTLYAAGAAIASDISIPLSLPVNTPSSPSAKQDNYIGLMRPVTLSLDASQLISSGAFVPSLVPGNRIDELLVFDNTVAAKNKSSSSVYYYWGNAWRRVGAGTNIVGSDNVFTPGTGVILRKGTNATAVWTNNPGY